VIAGQGGQREVVWMPTTLISIGISPINSNLKTNY